MDLSYAIRRITFLADQLISLNYEMKFITEEIDKMDLKETDMPELIEAMQRFQKLEKQLELDE